MKKRGNVTTRAEFRARLIKEITLPSGAVVEVRQPSMLTLAADENTPDLLRGYVLKSVEAGTKGEKSPDFSLGEVKAENFKGYIDLINCLARACLVNPRVVDDKPEDELADDEILLDYLSDEDKTTLVGFAFRGEGNAAARFPNTPAESVGASLSSEGIQSTS